MEEALQRAIREQVFKDPEVEPNDHFLININSNRSRHSYHSSRMLVRDWLDNTHRAQEIMQQISRMNSNEQFRLNDSLSLHTSHIQDPDQGSDNNRIWKGTIPLSARIADVNSHVKYVRARRGKQTDDDHPIHGSSIFYLSCCDQAASLLQRLIFSVPHFHHESVRFQPRRWGRQRAVGQSFERSGTSLPFFIDTSLVSSRAPFRRSTKELCGTINVTWWWGTFGSWVPTNLIASNGRSPPASYTRAS